MGCLVRGLDGPSVNVMASVAVVGCQAVASNAGKSTPSLVSFVGCAQRAGGNWGRLRLSRNYRKEEWGFRAPVFRAVAGVVQAIRTVYVLVLTFFPSPLSCLMVSRLFRWQAVHVQLLEIICGSTGPNGVQVAQHVSNA